MRNKRGFTLIELLVVIGVLAVLLALTLIAINPARQFSQANDTKRQADVNTILNAIGQYQAGNGGALPAGIPTDGTAAVISEAGADICGSLVPDFIAALPRDPGSSNGDPVPADCPVGYATGYNVTSENGRVTVSATGELAGPISATR